MGSFKLITILLMAINVSYAYKFSIVTDQASGEKAEEVKKVFEKTYPFNTFEIDYEVVKVDSNELNCASRYGIDRLIVCKDTYPLIKKLRKESGANQILIVKDLNKYGGSGGSTPVITTHKLTDPKTMIHEYMHTLGFADEYQYSKAEAEEYCNMENVNVVYIEPNPLGYSNDQDARSQHFNKIPWNKNILSTTKITHSEEKALGTGTVSRSMSSIGSDSEGKNALTAAIGLYEGHTCVESKMPKHSWQPGFEKTIMEEIDAGIGVGNEKILNDILIAKGLVKKPEIQKEKIEVVNSNKDKEIQLENKENEIKNISK